MTLLPKATVLDPQFRVHATALTSAAQHIATAAQEEQKNLNDAAAAANIQIAEQISLLPQNPLVQAETILAMMTDMRKEFRERFVEYRSLLFLYD